MFRSYMGFRNRRNTTISMKNWVLRSNNSSEGLQLKYIRAAFSRNYFIKSSIEDYAATELLPLPPNVKNLVLPEKLNFSKKRNREINGSLFSSSLSSSEPINTSFADDRIECYDCFGAINLSASMQTNVPYPFISRGKPTHLNMPGGLWGQREKYMSGDLNNIHHINLRFFSSKSGDTCSVVKGESKNSYLCLFEDKYTFLAYKSQCNFAKPLFKNLSLSSVNGSSENVKTNQNESKEIPLNFKQKLKVAVVEYGSIVMVVHISIALLNLSLCYLAVKSEIDLSKIIKYWGIEEGAASAGTAAHFVIAYAIHKATAPIRTGITLALVPFIVKKLRKRGFFKSKKPKTI